MSEPTTDLPIVHDAADIESVEQLERPCCPSVAKPHRTIGRSDVVGDLWQDVGGVGALLRFRI